MRECVSTSLAELLTRGRDAVLDFRRCEDDFRYEDEEGGEELEDGGEGRELFPHLAHPQPGDPGTQRVGYAVQGVVPSKFSTVARGVTHLQR